MEKSRSIMLWARHGPGNRQALWISSDFLLDTRIVESNPPIILPTAHIPRARWTITAE